MFKHRLLPDAQRDAADLWLINSCTVKGPSQAAMNSLITAGSGAGKALLVTGCVPQGDKKAKELQNVSLLGEGGDCWLHIRVTRAAASRCYRQKGDAVEETTHWAAVTPAHHPLAKQIPTYAASCLLVVVHSGVQSWTTTNKQKMVYICIQEAFTAVWLAAIASRSDNGGQQQAPGARTAWRWGTLQEHEQPDPEGHLPYGCAWVLAHNTHIACNRRRHAGVIQLHNHSVTLHNQPPCHYHAVPPTHPPPLCPPFPCPPSCPPPPGPPLQA
jgi:hypothetical protein